MSTGAGEIVDLDLDRARIGEHDRAVADRVRTDRHHADGRQHRVQDGAAGRQGVGGRTGRRGDDDAVAASRPDQFVVHPPRVLDHAARLALGNDGVVQRDTFGHACAVAVHRRAQENTLLRVVAAGEDFIELFGHALRAHVREEAEPAKVDADQRHRGLRKVTGEMQHGAVAADGDAEIQAVLDRLDYGGDIAGEQVEERLVFGDQIHAPRAQVIAQRPHGVGDTRLASPGEQPDTPKSHENAGT